MRIRLTPFYIDGQNFSSEVMNAEIRTLGKSGIIDIRYLGKKKVQEVLENGFGYVNQPKERIV